MRWGAPQAPGPPWAGLGGGVRLILIWIVRSPSSIALSAADRLSRAPSLARFARLIRLFALSSRVFRTRSPILDSGPVRLVDPDSAPPCCCPAESDSPPAADAPSCEVSPSDPMGPAPHRCPRRLPIRQHGRQTCLTPSQTPALSVSTQRFYSSCVARVTIFTPVNICFASRARAVTRVRSGIRVPGKRVHDVVRPAAEARR